MAPQAQVDVRHDDAGYPPLGVAPVRQPRPRRGLEQLPQTLLQERGVGLVADARVERLADRGLVERTGQLPVVALEVAALQKAAFVQHLAELFQQFQRELDPVFLPVGRLDLRQGVLAVEELQRARGLDLQAQDVIAQMLRVADAESLPPLLPGNREDVDVAKPGTHGRIFVAHGNRL